MRQHTKRVEVVACINDAAAYDPTCSFTMPMTLIPKKKKKKTTPGSAFGNMTCLYLNLSDKRTHLKPLLQGLSEHEAEHYIT